MSVASFLGVDDLPDEVSLFHRTVVPRKEELPSSPIPLHSSLNGVVQEDFPDQVSCCSSC